MAKYVVFQIGNAAKQDILSGMHCSGWVVDASDTQSAVLAAAVTDGDGRYAAGPAAPMDVYRVESSKVRNATLEA